MHLFSVFFFPFAKRISMFKLLCCCCCLRRRSSTNENEEEKSEKFLDGGCAYPTENWIEAIKDPITKDEKLPTTRLEPCELHELLSRFPFHLQNRKLKRIYTSDAHGYSMRTLRRKCEAVGEGYKHAGVLIIGCSGLKIGAYMSALPQWNSVKPFVGTTETFLFRFPRNSPLIKVFGGKEGGNQNFIRAEEASISIGSGPQGPALKLGDNATKVSSAVSCPTFNDYDGESLLVEADPKDCTSLDSDTCRTAVVTFVEFWAVGEALADVSQSHSKSVPCCHAKCPHDCPH